MWRMQMAGPRAAVRGVAMRHVAPSRCDAMRPEWHLARDAHACVVLARGLRAQ